VAIPASPEERAGYPRWWSVLAVGAVLWMASVAVTGFTRNPILLPTVVLLGSFLVPVTVMVWYLDHYRSTVVTVRAVFDAFVVGGVLGILLASLLESWLLSDGALVYVGVGLIEEAVKLAALVYVARRIHTYTVRDGVVLGAAVGFGFGALESSGYALNALIQTHGATVHFSLAGLVVTELVRGVIAPVGHGLWTAILGGVLFGSAHRRGRLRPAWSVLWAYLGVSALHSLWDSMQGIAVLVSALVTSTPLQRIAATAGAMAIPSSRQEAVFVAVDWGGLVVVSIIGLIGLRGVWRAGAAASAG
jgi:RsiW-degrading membrane proteinase PrsW (M82 family)